MLRLGVWPLAWVLKIVVAICLLIVAPLTSELVAQENLPEVQPKLWHEKINIRGYTQFRHNRIFASNSELVSEQGDRSIGGNNNFFVRRARLIFFGDLSDFVSFYTQPDLASSPAGSAGANFAQLRDIYADIFLDRKKEFRLRLGQSKIPFSFENLQSSQNRLPLDRNDALNTAAKDERDMGAFFYWAPTDVRKRFRYLVDSGLKGSGDYGVLGVGLYNGQTANKPEANNNMHAIARLSYPFELPGGQFMELSLQGYSGLFVVNRSPGVGGLREARDQRVAGSFILYPQPFGLQAEYNLGIGPEHNLTTNEVVQGQVEGGYVLVNYRFGEFIPFVRTHYYLGGRKHETNSPRHKVRETELGLEWQFGPSLELTMMYTVAERTNPKQVDTTEFGRFGRMQVQWNY
jgi:hypothetical protein